MNQLKQLRDELHADYHRPEGRWGLHGHSCVDDDYFCALEYVIGRIDTMLAENKQAEPVAHTVIAGVLFDFMGWLTSRDERIVLSARDLATPAVDALKRFAELRGFSLDSAKVQDWQNYTHPPQPVQPDFSDAYRGARQDAEIWKKRALEAEELNRKFIADINGHTFMGEPAQPVQPAVAQEPVACIGTNGELMWLKIPDVLYSKPVPLYTPAPATAINEQLLEALKLADAALEGAHMNADVVYKKVKAAIEQAEAEKAKGVCDGE